MLEQFLQENIILGPLPNEEIPFMVLWGSAINEVLKWLCPKCIFVLFNIIIREIQSVIIFQKKLLITLTMLQLYIFCYAISNDMFWTFVPTTDCLLYSYELRMV